jgi:hypothetical protein
MGTGHQKNWDTIRWLVLSAPLPNLKGAERGNDIINHACEMKPPENPKGLPSDSFHTAEHMEVPGGWCAQRQGGLPLVYMPYACVSCAQFFLINGWMWVKCFLSSVSHSGKLIEPKERMVGTLIYSQLVRSTSHSAFDWHLKGRGLLWDWAP